MCKLCYPSEASFLVVHFLWHRACNRGGTQICHHHSLQTSKETQGRDKKGNKKALIDGT